MSTSDKLKIFFPLQLWENNSILRKKSQKIEKITPEIREFWEILLELMREYDGVGLAAPQIWENIAMIATTQWKRSHKEKIQTKIIWEKPYSLILKLSTNQRKCKFLKKPVFLSREKEEMWGGMNELL